MWIPRSHLDSFNMCIGGIWSNMNSAYSQHMTGNKNLFLSLKKKEGRYVVFENNGKGKLCELAKW